MDMILNNFAQITGNARRETFEGRSYQVFPVVLVREGVLNGELVLAEEIAKFVDAWNGRPLPIAHPQNNGRYVSANNPQILQKQSVGFIFNAFLDGDALKGEAWIDEAKAASIGGRALKALRMAEQGDPLEVSTGYFRDVETTPGEFKGVKYSSIARNIRPDHLALLPDDVGACDWSMGCGLGRNASDLPGPIKKLSSLLTQLSQLINRSPADIQTNSSIMEALSMDKKKTVDALIANSAAPWKETHRDFLMGQDDTFLKTQADAYPEKSAEPAPAANGGCGCPNHQPQANAGAANAGEENQILKALQDLNTNVKTMGDRLTVLEQRDPEKDQLVAQLAANEACPMEAADLQALTVDKLRKLVDQFAPASDSFYGARPVPVGNSGAKIEPLAVPSLDEHYTQKKEA